jgi:hypothetical protein
MSNYELCHTSPDPITTVEFSAFRTDLEECTPLGASITKTILLLLFVVCDGEV